MSFTDTKSPGDVISSTDWNDFVDYTEEISGTAYWASGQIQPLSGAFWAHSSNSLIHFTKNSIILSDLSNVSDMSPSNGDVLTWDSTNNFWSSQAGGGGGGASNLSELTIDTNKDWQNYSIYNLQSISSQHISSSSINGNWTGYPIEQTYLKSGSDYWSAHLSSQSLKSLAFKDSIDISSDTNLAVSYPITLSDDTIGINLASSTVSGALKASDWVAFNNKQNQINFGTLSNGNGIKTLSVGISGSNGIVSVDFGSSDTQVASGSHLHDDRYYTKTQSASNYYPSSLGHNHVNDSSIHFTKSNIDTVGTITTGTWHGSAIEQLYLQSGSQYYQAFLHSSNTNNPHNTSITNLSDTAISTPQSGQLLTYNGQNWVNYPPSITFNIANVRISSQQNINLARFHTPTNKSVYVWQAEASNSGGASIGDLKIQLLSGNSIIYSTSSNTVQIGYPLAKAAGNIEIRFAYSGSNVTGIQYGTAFINISVL